MTDPKIGTHGFSGACSPDGENDNWRFETFSVGVFQWEAKANGKPKKGKAKVRVIGSYADPDSVYAAANLVVRQLDDGTYTGPKRIVL